MNDCFFTVISHIVKRLYQVYGMPINRRSIRSALLAFAEADLLFKGENRFKQQLEDHSAYARKALQLKDCRSFDSEEFYTIFFLSLSERCRCDHHCRVNGGISEQIEARKQHGVHVNGMMAMIDHLSTRPAVSLNEEYGEAWLHIGKFLAVAGSMATSGEVLKVASIFRQDLSDNQTKSMQGYLTHGNGFFLLALENILTAED